VASEKPTPGLRFDDNGRPFWRASKPAVRAGYPVKSVNLSELVGDEARLSDRCVKLQREMDEWLLNGTTGAARPFDGTFKSLLDIYATDPESSYFELKGPSRKPYDTYIALLRFEIGASRIDLTDGTDIKKWFAGWVKPRKPGGKRTVARARFIIAVIKAALSHGIIRRLPGCADLRAILREIEFESLRSRDAVITANQVTAARAAAHQAGHAPAAFCYALQFEGTGRQWDLRGVWVPMSDPRPSAIHDAGKKWIGPTWANVDDNLILRITPSKTEDTTALDVVVDFRFCPMVMEELEHIPTESRTGPLVVNPKTGLPYREDTFNRVWKAAAKVAGIPASYWNRDLRASGVTEAREGDAKTDDLKKLAGHSAKSKTTGKVYDRAVLAAHRRIAAARSTVRPRKG